MAEGTIFRVFADKADLIGQAVVRSVSAEPTVARLRRIDPALDLEAKLVQVTTVLQQRLRHTFGLLQALGPPPGATDEGRRAFTRHMDEQNRLVTAAVAHVIDSDQDDLVLTPAQTVQLLATVTLGVSHPMLAHAGIVHLSDDPEAVVDLVLRGALAGAAPSAHRFDHRRADPSPLDPTPSPAPAPA